MTVWEALACASLCAVLAYVLKEAKSGYAALVPLLGGLLLLLGGVARLSALEQIRGLLERTGLSEMADLVLRVLGVGYLGELGAELCRELGAAGLGARLEFFARVEIFLICLPSLTELFTRALELLG